MYMHILYVLLLAASSLPMSVIRNSGDSCSEDQWKCDDGSCVSTDAKWNDIFKCQNNSDPPLLFRRNSRQAQEGMCVLPEFPASGSYTTRIPNAKPGDAYNFVTLNVTCDEGFAVNGPTSIYCDSGWWPQPMPQCVSQCYLPSHPSVEFHCLVTGNFKGSRACGEYEISGTVVSPKCSPHYYSTTVLPHMHCIDGHWDNIAAFRCIPECGTVSSSGTQLLIGGNTAGRAQVPWHVGIYTKTMDTYMQICGGSLISSNYVLSAAHCFWNEFEKKPQPASNFAVSAGSLYSDWYNVSEDTQRSDVKALHLPTLYQSSDAHFQEDIAIVVLTSPFKYTAFLRPVCVDLDISFQNRQLKVGNTGKVAGWGLTAENGKPSLVLNVIDLPYVSIETCKDGSPEEFRGYITSDKMCAGFKNEHKALCKGDSGGGLAFPDVDRGIKRYYLRGITSTAPKNDNFCNANNYITFTKIPGIHEEFIKQFWVNEDILQIEQLSNRKEVTKRPQQGSCILPDNPNNGIYISNMLDAKPGDAFDSVTINVSCQQGYGLDAAGSVSCYKGKWTEMIPKCVLQCQLKPHPSVEYRCRSSESAESYRPCNEFEITGTVVSPQCRSPGYYSAIALSMMKCVEDKWDHVAKCSQECGTVIPEDVNPFEISAKRAEVPWHADIYTKTEDPYLLVCGGSLIRNNIIISGAHYFWSSSEGKLAASNFAVAVGNLHSAWDIRDGVQQSNVKEVHLPDIFQATESKHQGDIAVVIVTKPFEFNDFVRPVCVDFDNDLEKKQLVTGKIGKLAGWDFNSENDKSVSQELQVIDLPYVDVVTCLTAAPSEILQFITVDKICAGYADASKRSCSGYFGSGLVFPSFYNGTQRYFLRGVLSNSGVTGNICSVNSYSSYTRISAHQLFIQQFLESDLSSDL